MAESSLVKRLVWYIDALLMEERKFHKWSCEHKQDYEDLEKMHQEGLPLHRNTLIDRRVQENHERVLDRHRALHQSHKEVEEHCKELLEKLRNGLVDDIDIPAELTKLSETIDKIRFDHNLIQRERKQLLREHFRFHRNRNGAA